MTMSTKQQQQQHTPAVVQEVGGHQHKVQVGGASQLQALLRQLHALVGANGRVNLKGHGQEGELRSTGP
eukprot:1150605-Pelagomonas_calceolata.AAC.1